MDKEDIKELIKDYLKDKLEISVITERYYGDFGSGEGVRVAVAISLDGEIIDSSYDYTTLN